MRASDEIDARATNALPVAAFSVSPSSADPGQGIQFGAGASHDPGGELWAPSQEDAMGELIPVEYVESRILEIRGMEVILDSDLAALYGVETRRLNEQMKRSRDRFPIDFVFQLSPEECVRLRSQLATSNVGRGGRRSLPFAQKEHGALRASSLEFPPRLRPATRRSGLPSGHRRQYSTS
jgi:hypothetical protein